MVLAIVLHARRPDEGRNIVLNAILGGIAAPVAFGRFVIAPLYLSVYATYWPRGRAL
jgi:hypothetical protein